jgi:hypothetical protein
VQAYGAVTAAQLRSNSACQFPVSLSRPVVHLTMEKKYLEERNILFVQLTEQELCLYDKCSLDYSRRDKTDLAWCRIALKMEKKG